jgi:hypothetical protein
MAAMDPPPPWARGKKPCARIGHHLFYKLGLDGRDERHSGLVVKNPRTTETTMSHLGNLVCGLDLLRDALERVADGEARPYYAIDPEDDRPESERARALCLLHDDDSEEWVDTECLGEILAWLERLPTPPQASDERA